MQVYIFAHVICSIQKASLSGEMSYPVDFLFIDNNPLKLMEPPPFI